MGTKVIFIGNYKGGVGKTTSTLNFAEYFSTALHPKRKKANRVLVLDIDPQSSLSEILVKKHCKTDLSDLEPYETLNYVFDLSIAKIQRYSTLELNLSKTAGVNLIKDGGSFDFIPSSLFYCRDAEGQNVLGLDTLALMMEDDLQYLTILRNFLEPLKTGYDYILIDCPPSNNLITRSAFLMSDFYLVPTVLDGLSTNGVVHYIETVENTYSHYCQDSEDAFLAKHFFGARPQLLGLFFNLIRGRVNYEDALDEFERIFRSKLQMNIDDFLLDSRINNYIDIARSTQAGTTSISKDDFRYLAQEILDRLER